MEDTYKGQVDNPLTLNRYTYTGNNPQRYVDPSGHEYGKLRDFVSDYLGEVTTEKTVIGTKMTYINRNNKLVQTTTDEPGVFSKIKPGTKGYYSPIWADYAKVTIGDKTAAFYFSDYQIKDGRMYMERTAFLDKMGIPYNYSQFNTTISKAEKGVRVSALIADVVIDPTSKSKIAGLMDIVGGMAANTLSGTDYPKEFTAQTGIYTIKVIEPTVNLGFWRGGDTAITHSEWIMPNGKTLWNITQIPSLEYYNLKYGN